MAKPFHKVAGLTATTRNDGAERTTAEAETSQRGAGEPVESPSPAHSPSSPPTNPPVPTKSALQDFVEALTGASFDQTEAQRSDAVRRILEEAMAKHKDIASQYNIVVIFDEGTMMRYDADRIYKAVSKFKKTQPLLMVLYSPGGYSDAAYLIGKACQEHAKDRFIVAVPRRAKSAATLLCCGADEIHMGSMSELGPVDPQIKNLPVLGLKNAMEHIAELSNKYPAAADMFAKYLKETLPLIHLGHYERIAESAMQYAERLLARNAKSLPKRPREIAKRLVYDYKDHGFVIDKHESQEIFGDKIVRHYTPEYKLADEIYEQLSLIRSWCDASGCGFYFIGAVDDVNSCSIYRRPSTPTT